MDDSKILRELDEIRRRFDARTAELTDRYVDVPAFRFRGIARRGQRYISEDDFRSWLYACRESARSAGLDETDQFLDGMIQVMSGMEVTNRRRRWL